MALRDAAASRRDGMLAALEAQVLLRARQPTVLRAVKLSLEGLDDDEARATLRVSRHELMGGRLVPQFTRLWALSSL